MKIILFELWGEELHESRSSQLQTQLLQLQKERLKKIQACTGFEPLTSVIPVQRSYKLSYKQTGSRSLYVNRGVNQNHMKVDHRSYRCNFYSFFFSSFLFATAVLSFRILHTQFLTLNMRHLLLHQPQQIEIHEIYLEGMRDMFRNLFTCVIIHVHACVSKGQTILSLQ